MTPPSSNPIADRQINDVLDRLHARAARQLPGIVAHYALEAVKGLVGAKRAKSADAEYYRDKLISIDRGQGWLNCTQCRGLHARRAVEFGTSYGVSTLYLAAAMRDQGTSLVIGTEIDAERRATRATISSMRELRN
jgi:predicted O-methyltransferase YrrM